MTTDCSYCGESVPDNEYTRHLEQEHYEELTTIDQRRVGNHQAGRKNRNIALYAGTAVVLALFVIGYIAIFAGSGTNASSAAIQPNPENQIHEHGTIVVQYDDTTVNFSDSQYIERDGCFHFHNDGHENLWHSHCEDVSIEYALETLDVEMTEDTLVIDDESFDANDSNTTVSVTVDGESVDPQEYVLDGVGPVDEGVAGEGDNVRIVAETDD